MDLLDKIERTEFLGREFLLYLWFASEVCEGQLPLDRDHHVELWFDDQLVLADPGEPQEKSTLKGLSPAGIPEAKEALRQGKLPMRAHLNLSLEDRSFAFTLDAPSLALSGIKLPTTGQDTVDEQFYERMMLLDELETTVEALFLRFVRMRMSRSFRSTQEPLLRDWIRQDTFDGEGARRKVERALRSGTDKSSAA